MPIASIPWISFQLYILVILQKEPESDHRQDKLPPHTANEHVGWVSLSDHIHPGEKQDERRHLRKQRESAGQPGQGIRVKAAVASSWKDEGGHEPGSAGPHAGGQEVHDLHHNEERHGGHMRYEGFTGRSRSVNRLPMPTCTGNEAFTSLGAAPFGYLGSRFESSHQYVAPSIANGDAHYCAGTGVVLNDLRDAGRDLLGRKDLVCRAQLV